MKLKHADVHICTHAVKKKERAERQQLFVLSFDTSVCTWSALFESWEVEGPFLRTT